MTNDELKYNQNLMNEVFPVLATYRPPLSLDEPCPVCGVKKMLCSGHNEQD